MKKPRPTRVLLFATHSNSSNGYSLVSYELSNYLAAKDDVQMSIYGFQNFTQIPNHRTNLHPKIFQYDAAANETPKQAGFGVGQVKDFVTSHKPDVCIVYNDMLVLTSVIQQLVQVPNRKFKIIAYIDQVYLCQKKEFINFVNQHADIAMLFTPYWEDVIKEQGITIPTCHLHHGFNSLVHYPIPTKLARKFYNIKESDFIILNLNRNQPRKRWDICLQAFAEVVKRFPDEPIKLLIATALTGAWNLLEIYERELKKRGITMEIGMKHIVLLDNPQQISDEDVNILYNVADIGLNTCDGEGFGLCNFQQAAIGIPQVVPHIGGFRDFFDETTALLVKPKMTYYVDNSRDMVCGEAELCDYNAFADAICKYYTDKELRQTHGVNARKRILTEYPWEKFGEKLYNIVKETTKDLFTIEEGDEEVEDDVNIETLQEMIHTTDEKGRIEEQVKKNDDEVVKNHEVVEEIQMKQKDNATNEKSKKKHSKPTTNKLLKEKLKEKLNNKAKQNDLDTIKELKEKLDKLLAKTSV